MERIVWPAWPRRAQTNQINTAQRKYLCLEQRVRTGMGSGVITGTGPGERGGALRHVHGQETVLTS